MTRNTKVIMPVHLYGQAADMDPLLAIAEKHGLLLIEDAAHSPGAAWEGRALGTIGNVGCFSFYPTKNLGAMGDGGAILTNDPALDARARVLRFLARVGRSLEEYTRTNPMVVITSTNQDPDAISVAEAAGAGRCRDRQP